MGVAARQLFVVAMLADWTPAMQALVRELRDDIDEMLSGGRGEPDAAWRPGGDGGSGQGPAELQLVELGVTVQRERGKA